MISTTAHPFSTTHERSGATTVRLLIIGCGNPMIGDDGIGPHIAETVATWDRPGVRSLSCHQLTPECAAELATATETIFIDAAPHTTHIELQPLEATAEESYSAGRPLTPQSLLSLTQSAYGHTPTAWLLTVPAAQFSLGRRLSPLALKGEKSALKLLRGLA